MNKKGENVLSQLVTGAIALALLLGLAAIIKFFVKYLFF